MKPGRVHLVGVGPGDPALLATRGRQLLSSADVVVCDPRIDSRLLRGVRPDAERIDAAALRAGTPDGVGRMLAEKAAAGLEVVRLVQGDALSGAAGETAALRAAGIPFAVVPGVPRVYADPACAGIPLGRSEAGDVVVLAGGPAATRATAVGEGGAATLLSMIDALLVRGHPPGEPAALIVDGALPTHRTFDGRLDAVRRAVADMPPGDTGVLVVGPSVKHRRQLRWFDNRPLSGRRVLVTRPREQAADLADRLLDLGAEPVEAPTIRIAPPDDYGPLDAACSAARSYDWIVFTSVNGVDAFMRRLLGGAHDIRALGGVRLCAIGPATAARLRRHGLKADLMPTEHRGEAVFDVLRRTGPLAGARVLLARADIARAMLADSLRAAGAEVTEATAYRTLLADGWTGPELVERLRARPVDVATFTSASTVRNFVRILGAGPAAALLAGTRVAAIGPVTAAAAAELGIDTTIMPATYTIPALVDAIAEHFAGESRAGNPAGS